MELVVVVENMVLIVVIGCSVVNSVKSKGRSNSGANKGSNVDCMSGGKCTVIDGSSSNSDGVSSRVIFGSLAKMMLIVDLISICICLSGHSSTGRYWSFRGWW